MRAGTGGIHHDLHLTELRHGDKPFHTVGCRRDPQALRARKTVRRRLDPHHRYYTQILRPTLDLEHQVGADVPGAHNRDPHTIRHFRSPSFENRAVMIPNGSITASKTSPGFTATIGPSAPDNTMSPARSGAPNSIAVAASHASAFNGSPRQSRPVPCETTSPFRRIVITTSAGLASSSRTPVDPTTN